LPEPPKEEVTLPTNKISNRPDKMGLKIPSNPDEEEKSVKNENNANPTT
jgi:hypothetical protein